MASSDKFRTTFPKEFRPIAKEEHAAMAAFSGILPDGQKVQTQQVVDVVRFHRARAAIAMIFDEKIDPRDLPNFELIHEGLTTDD